MIEIKVETNAKEIAAQLNALQFRVVNAERAALHQVRDLVLQDYKRTTASWRHRVEFNAYESQAGNTHTIRVSTDDKIYKFVDKGTRPHIIRPKKPGGRLAFRWGGFGSYVAKTQPGYIISRDGGAHGPIVYRREVHHPGTEPRRFSELIKKQWEAKAPEVLRRFIELALTGKPFGRQE